MQCIFSPSNYFSLLKKKKKILEKAVYLLLTYLTPVYLFQGGISWVYLDWYLYIVNLILKQKSDNLYVKLVKGKTVVNSLIQGNL